MKSSQRTATHYQGLHQLALHPESAQALRLPPARQCIGRVSLYIDEDAPMANVLLALALRLLSTFVLHPAALANSRARR
jgi:hypothetical protein